MHYKKHFSLFVLLGLLSYNVQALESSNLNLRAFFGHPTLKDKSGNSLTLVKMDGLHSELGNIATGQQAVSISLQKNSPYSIKVGATTIYPSESKVVNIPVDDKGDLQFEITANNEAAGVDKLSIDIDEITSKYDIVWEPYDPVISEFKPTDKKTIVSEWSPTVSTWSQPNSTGTSFTMNQTRQYDQVYERSVQPREKERYSGKIRNSGTLSVDTKTERKTESRTVNITLSNSYGKIRNCTHTNRKNCPGKGDIRARSCKQQVTSNITFVANGQQIGQRSSSTQKRVLSCEVVHRAGH